MTKRRQLFGATMMAGVFGALASTSWAQGVAAPDPRMQAPPPADEAEVEAVVVTGSRLARPGTAAPTPTVILGSEDIAASGVVSIGELVRELPAVAPGVTSESSGPTFNAAGLNLVDLRSLGTNRTLVLVNGRRQVGSQPNTTAVDLNSIPTPLIERVEVITGGASAVYGADAVSGVVNLILKNRFEGVRIDAQGGVSSRSDAERYSLSATAGANFADDRGNVVVHAGYSKEESIEFDARPGGISGRNWVNNPANTGPRDGIPDYVILDNVRQLAGQQESAFILTLGGRRQVFGFNPDGSVRPFALGPSGLLPGTQLTDGGEATLGYDPECPQNKCQIRVPVERVLLSAMANYEVSDFLELFLEGRFAETKSEARIGSVFEIPPVTNNISINNPYVTPSLRALMQQAGVSTIGILRSNQELGPRGQDADRRLYQLTTGARGDLGIGNFRYDASFQYGSTRFVNTRLNDKFEDRSQRALDAVIDPRDGVIKCRSVVAGNNDGCVPINFLLPGAALTQQQLAYIKIPFHTETAELSQLVGTAVVTGDLFELWAGPIAVAAGVEYRKERSDYRVSAIDESGQGFFRTRRRTTTGEFDVREIFGEAIIPIARDLPFADSANIELAVRRSDYSTSGETTSWKVGADWAPTQDVRFRAVKAKAVRAPNVGELFSPGSEGFITVDDPCDVSFVRGGAPARAAACTALGISPTFVSNARSINIRTSTSGNPTLGVESADTLTLGAVFTPRFLPRLSFTVDYFDITIEDAVSVFGAQDILNNCVDLGSIDNVFCGSVSRGPGGDILQIRRQNINVSSFDREGVDLEARYRLDLDDKGRLDLAAVASRTLKVTTIVAPGTLTGGATLDENGEIGDPKWKARFNGRYSLNDFSFNATVSYLSSMVPDNQPSQPEDNRATTPTGDFWLTDLQAGYTLFGDVQLTAGVDNVFDALPPDLPDTRLGGTGSFDGAEIYPSVGRYFYLGVSVTL